MIPGRDEGMVSSRAGSMGGAGACHPLRCQPKKQDAQDVGKYCPLVMQHGGGPVGNLKGKNAGCFAEAWLSCWK